MKKLLLLAVCIAVPQLAGAIGSYFTVPAVGTWYRTLNFPSFHPPSWIFGPVWIFLYALMGIALFQVAANRAAAPVKKKKAVLVFGQQLVLNMLWSVVFFGMHSIAGGLTVILLLWFIIMLNIKSFYAISKPAGLLLVPYILWVSFAAVLNYSILRLNS